MAQCSGDGANIEGPPEGACIKVALVLETKKFPFPPEHKPEGAIVRSGTEETSKVTGGKFFDGVTEEDFLAGHLISLEIAVSGV